MSKRYAVEDTCGGIFLELYINLLIYWILLTHEIHYGTNLKYQNNLNLYTHHHHSTKHTQNMVSKAPATPRGDNNSSDDTNEKIDSCKPSISFTFQHLDSLTLAQIISLSM